MAFRLTTFEDFFVEEIKIDTLFRSWNPSKFQDKPVTANEIAVRMDLKDMHCFYSPFSNEDIDALMIKYDIYDELTLLYCILHKALVEQPEVQFFNV